MTIHYKKEINSFYWEYSCKIPEIRSLTSENFAITALLHYGIPLSAKWCSLYFVPIKVSFVNNILSCVVKSHSYKEIGFTDITII